MLGYQTTCMSMVLRYRVNYGLIVKLKNKQAITLNQIFDFVGYSVEVCVRAYKSTILTTKIRST